MAPSPLRMLDPRRSDAVIVNVNYPLGLAAYHILSQVGMATDRLHGVYVLGKAATLDNQKAVTVKGTYLQNQGYLDFYYRENFTVVEMEAGPYLNAIYEELFLGRYPADDAINLRFPTPGLMDLGIIHYAS